MQIHGSWTRSDATCRYDPSTKGLHYERSISTTSNASPGGGRSFRVGSHSWDLVPMQRSRKSLTASS